MPNPNEIDLSVIVNGQAVTVEANEHAPLRTIVPKALELSGNVGQPVENWELRDESGQLLDLAKKVSEFGFVAGTKLFLTLKAGVGG